jgi:hypothetical protein
MQLILAMTKITLNGNIFVSGLPRVLSLLSLNIGQSATNDKIICLQ